MNWARYMELDAEAIGVVAGATVTVTFSFNEFAQAKHGMMLLRRWPEQRSDLERVNNDVSPLVGKVYDAFAAIPEVKAIRDEQMRMLKDHEETRRG